MIRGWFVGWMAAIAIWVVLYAFGVWSLLPVTVAFLVGLIYSSVLSMIGMAWGAKQDWR